MLIVMHLAQVFSMFVFLHPSNKKTSSNLTKMIIKGLLIFIGVVYLAATISFCTMCYIYADDWDMFQAKGEIVQFDKGVYLDEVTFHWFEIELCAIPSKIVYYMIAYYFFLKHR